MLKDEIKTLIKKEINMLNKLLVLFTANIKHPASISNYASQYGAGSNVGENTIANPNALNKEFAKVGGNTLLNHNLNQEQVNSRAKDMKNSTDMPNNQQIKHDIVNSDIAKTNKQEGDNLKNISKDFNPLGKNSSIL